MSLELAVLGDNFLIFVLRLMDIGVFRRVSDIRKLSLELAVPGDNFLIFVLRLMDIGVFGSTSTQDTYYAILCVGGVLE